MKKITNVALALLLVASNAVSVFAAPLASANITIPGNASTDVQATVSATKFGVTVPTGLPVNIDETGLITVSDKAKIVNTCTAPVFVENIKVTPANTWELVEYLPDFKTTYKIGERKLGMQLNTDDVAPDTHVRMKAENWPAIYGNTELPLIYTAKLPIQKETYVQQAASVIFTVGFYEPGSAIISEANPTQYDFVPKDTRVLKLDFKNIVADTDAVQWESSNPTIATVEPYTPAGRSLVVSGTKQCKVTAKAVGDAVISGKLADGTIKTLNIHVTEKKVKWLEVTKQPTKLTYTEGENLNTAGLNVAVTYNNGEKDILVGGVGCTYSNDKNLAIGTQTISVMYGGAVTTLTVTVHAKQITSLALTTPPTTTTYTPGSQFNTTGMVITATYNNGTTGIITQGTGSDAYQILDGQALTAGQQTVTISANNKTLAIPITVGTPSTPEGAFTFEPGTGKITGVDKAQLEGITNLVIPDTINGVPVKIIGNSAITGLTSPTSISIPDTVTTIEYAAFQDNLNVQTIKFPTSLQTIGGQAFAYCSNLQSIILQNTTVKTIESNAFPSCLRVTEITLPMTVRSMDGAFKTNNSPVMAERIYIDAPVDSITTSGSGLGGAITWKAPTPEKYFTWREEDAMGWGFNQAVITGYNSDMPGAPTDILIPNELGGLQVVEIGSGAFENNHKITSVVTMGNTSVIGRTAFMNCINLTSAWVRNGVTALDVSAFNGCTKLKTVSLSENLTTISKYAFNGCTSLEYISIPNSVATMVASIGGRYNQFSGCTSLKHINIENVAGALPGAPWGAPSNPKITTW